MPRRMLLSVVMLLGAVGCYNPMAVTPETAPPPITSLAPSAAPGPCPVIEATRIRQTRDSIYIDVRLKQAPVAEHGDTWFVQTVLFGEGDGGRRELYVRGGEEKEGFVPIRHSAGGGDFQIVGYGTERALTSRELTFSVPRSVIGAALEDDGIATAFGSCESSTFFNTEAGNPQWQPVRHVPL